MKSYKFSIILVLIISLFLAGCQYVLTEQEQICEPPNKKVTDIYGNIVCITPENCTGDDCMVDVDDDDKEAMPEDEPETETDDDTEDMTGEDTGNGDEQEDMADEEISESDVPRKIVTEGELVSFPNLAAEDPDGDKLEYAFSEPLDENGEWQTEAGDAGEYDVTIIISDGSNNVEQKIKIIVQPLNNAPVISGVDDKLVVQEGDTVSFNPVVTDADGDEVAVTYSGWMTSDSYKTGFDDAGEYVVEISADDGITVTKEIVTIVVENVNRPPEIKQIKDLQVEVGDMLKIEPAVTDPDGDEILLSFSEPFNEDGEWTPGEEDAGTYEVIVTANDGEASEQVTFTLTVGTPNEAPLMEQLDDIIVNEGEEVVIEPRAEDPEGEEVIFTFSGWMTESTYQTNYEDAGNYTVTVTASDGENEVSQNIQIIVNNVNRPPQVNPDWWK